MAASGEFTPCTVKCKHKGPYLIQVGDGEPELYHPWEQQAPAGVLVSYYSGTAVTVSAVHGCIVCGSPNHEAEPHGIGGNDCGDPAPLDNPFGSRAQSL